MQRIALWNTAFLGDAVLTLPLLQSLKARFPQASIDFYVRKGLAPLFAAQPELAHVYEFDKTLRPQGLFASRRFRQELAARKYDLWISAHTSVRSAAIARASKAPMRIGYAGFARQLAYTHPVDRHFTELAEIERLLELLKPLDALMEHPLPPNTWPNLVLAPAAHAYAAELFASFGNAPLLGLHPGSVWPTKRWKVEGFAEIGRRALETGAHVILFAGKGEEGVVAELATHIGAHPHLHNVACTLDLPQLAACLARLKCYVSNDSGPMHLAWVQHVPVVAVFGPTVEALGFFPRGNAIVVETDLPCRPCTLHGPKRCPLKHHDCMRRISADMVWPHVRRALAATI